MARVEWSDERNRFEFQHNKTNMYITIKLIEENPAMVARLINQHLLEVVACARRN